MQWNFETFKAFSRIRKRRTTLACSFEDGNPEPKNWPKKSRQKSLRFILRFWAEAVLQTQSAHKFKVDVILWWFNTPQHCNIQLLFPNTLQLSLWCLMHWRHQNRFLWTIMCLIKTNIIKHLTFKCHLCICNSFKDTGNIRLFWLKVNF